MPVVLSEKRTAVFESGIDRQAFRNEIINARENRCIIEVKVAAKSRKVGMEKLMLRKKRHYHFPAFLSDEPPLACHKKIYIPKRRFSCGTENLMPGEGQGYFLLLSLLPDSLLTLKT